MSKRKLKKGQFSTRSKTAFQDQFRMDKLETLRDRKDNLSKREKSLLNASSALEPSRSSYGKAGRFFDKNARIDRLQSKSQQSASGFDGNLNKALNQGTSISIAGFTQNKSPTGVLSQKDVYSGITGFVDNLKNTANVKNVKVEKQGDKITGLDVFRDYQKADFDFNPVKLSFETKGWDLDIPEEYIKVSDTKYVAPSKKFTKRYDYERDDDDTDRDRSYANYTPVELFLNDSGDKLSRVLKRDTYTKVDKYERDEDSRERYYEKDAFTSEIQDYFGTGLMKQQKLWDDYTIREEEERDGREREEEEIRGIYLKEQKDFNEDGYLTAQKRWSPYTSREEEERVGDRRYKEEEQKIGFSDIQYFDARGRRQAQYRYDDYLSDVDVDAERDFYNISEGRRLSSREQRELLKRNKQGQVTQAEADNISFQDGYEKEEEYELGLRTITFYDPITGKPVENVRNW